MTQNDLLKVKEIIEYTIGVFEGYALDHQNKGTFSSSVKAKQNMEYAVKLKEAIHLIESAIAEEKQ